MLRFDALLIIIITIFLFFCTDSDLRQLFYIFLVNQHDEEDQCCLLVSPESPQVTLRHFRRCSSAFSFSRRRPERKACVEANARCRITDTLGVTWGHVCFRTRCLVPLNYPGCSLVEGIIFSSICSSSEHRYTKHRFWLFFPLFSSATSTL